MSICQTEPLLKGKGPSSPIEAIIEFSILQYAHRMKEHVTRGLIKKGDLPTSCPLLHYFLLQSKVPNIHIRQFLLKIRCISPWFSAHINAFKYVPLQIFWVNNFFFKVDICQTAVLWTGKMHTLIS